VQALSGGNAQKVSIGSGSPDTRAFSAGGATRGVDVGARAEIYRLLRALAMRDCGAVCQHDLDEVLGFGERVPSSTTTGWCTKRVRNSPRRACQWITHGGLDRE